MKSSRCSWSCDAQAFFLNPKLLTSLELQGISCIVFVRVTCNTSNQRERKKNDDFCIKYLFLHKFFKVFVDKTTRSYCCVHSLGCSLSYRGRFHNSLSFIILPHSTPWSPYACKSIIMQNAFSLTSKVPIV